jgi:hypothetical protein
MLMQNIRQAGEIGPKLAGYEDASSSMERALQRLGVELFGSPATIKLINGATWLIDWATEFIKTHPNIFGQIPPGQQQGGGNLPPRQIPFFPPPGVPLPPPLPPGHP